MPLANLIRDTAHAVVEALGLEESQQGLGSSRDELVEVLAN